MNPTPLQATAPSIANVLRSLPNERATHRNALGVSLVVVAVAAWGALFALTLAVDSPWLKFLCATVLGMTAGVVFVVGHDTCHGSLTSSARFNRFATWILFLPSLHPATSWEWGHNRMHHSWTNLITKDDAFPPLTLAQWNEKSLLQRGLWRFYYSLPGMGFYYMIDVWWRDIICLNRSERAELRTARIFFLELAMLAAFVAIQIVVVASWGSWQGQSLAWRIGEIALCIAWPFIVWNWIMAFVIFQHHTHPRVRWFDDEAEWSYFQSQIGGTVHVKFPRIIELAFANIFEHTAHHADKRMPLYNLPQSQSALERQYPGDVIVQRASLAHLRDVLKRCRLYDYRANRWMDFDGRYTS